MSQQPEEWTYERVIEEGIWLESRGDFSRYATDGEESVWVNELTEEIADPDEPKTKSQETTMATCNGEAKPGKTKVHEGPCNRSYSPGLTRPVLRLLDAMKGMAGETACSPGIETLNKVHSALRQGHEDRQGGGRFEDDLYLAGTLGPLLGEIDLAHSRLGYTLSRHGAVVGDVRKAMIGLFSRALIVEVMLPDTFPDWMVPGEVAQAMNGFEGSSLWDAASAARERGWNPVSQRLLHHGETVWGFGLDVGGLSVPFMVRLGLRLPESIH